MGGGVVGGGGDRRCVTKMGGDDWTGMDDTVWLLSAIIMCSTWPSAVPLISFAAETDRWGPRSPCHLVSTTPATAAGHSLSLS